MKSFPFSCRSVSLFHTIRFLMKPPLMRGWFTILYKVVPTRINSSCAMNYFCNRSEEHTSELQSRQYLVCRLLLEKKKKETMKSNQTRKNQVEIEDIHSSH